MPLIVPESIIINVYLPGIEEMFVSLSVSPLLTSERLLEKIFHKYMRTVGEKASGKTIDQYVIKSTGFQEYFYGTNQLIGYDYFRKLVSTQKNVVLSLIEISSIEDLLQSLTSTYHSIVDDLIILEADAKKEEDEEFLEISSVTELYRVRVMNINKVITPGVVLSDNAYLYVLVEIYHAGHKLGEGFTMGVPACSDPRWNEIIVFQNIIYSHLTLGCKILFTVFVRNYDANSGPWVKALDKNDEPIAWVGSQLFDHRYRKKHGQTHYRMWSGARANPIGTCSENLLKMNAPILFVDYTGKILRKRIFFPRYEPLTSLPNVLVIEETKHKIDAIIKSSDPLAELTAEDKMIMWTNRYIICNIASALPKFLLSINWSDPVQVKEAHRILPLWAKPSPLQALELLDAKFVDPIIRDYGVDCMQYLSDGECFDFMLQLTQVLKHEPYHNSALAMFLLKRAWNNRNIANSFYWFLKAEMHLGDLAERYTLLLEAYVRGDERILKELLKQQEVSSQLINVAIKVKNAPKEERERILCENLEKIKFPGAMELPLNQKMQVNDLIIPKCKYMDSKKLPLWLVWNNSESIAKPIYVIFKVGDDLRQDVLTLQVIRIFDKVIFSIRFIYGR